MFFFVTGENKGAEMGEHELGTRPARGFPLARAVAASSAFPPVFPPLKLTKKEYDVPDVDYVTLTDGGVYDNLGANPLFRERNALDYALVSDAGKPFEIEDRPTEWGSIVLKESIGILMEQVRGLQFKRLELARGREPETEGAVVLDRQRGGRGAARGCGVRVGGRHQPQEAERRGDDRADAGTRRRCSRAASRSTRRS